MIREIVKLQRDWYDITQNIVKHSKRCVWCIVVESLFRDSVVVELSYQF